MNVNPAEIAFQYIALLFAISLHEAAHAWSASRCGDQTARMLGRVTLNPIKHADPIGTVLLPLLAMFTGLTLLGWGKPTPVTPRNFKSLVRDDILVSMAGPASNLIAALSAVILVKAIVLSSTAGKIALVNVLEKNFGAPGVLTPIVFLLFSALQVNVVLAVFNVIPIPPLDGSHVLRHFLPAAALRAYDAMGMIGLLILVYFGGRFLAMLIDPVWKVFIMLLFWGLR